LSARDAAAVPDVVTTTHLRMRQALRLTPRRTLYQFPVGITTLHKQRLLTVMPRIAIYNPKSASQNDQMQRKRHCG
jgi:hypothetical protein